jgi:solute carrier family 25 protein 39/40
VTPFDVVKTRLQTQGAPPLLFKTVHQLPTAMHYTPASDPPQPTASTSKGAPRMPSTATAMCCQPTTFFGCRFDTARSISGVAVQSLEHGGAVATFAPGNGPGLALMDAEAACAYPTAKAAKAGLRKGSPHLDGMLDAVVKIVRNEGPSALWRGVGPALAMSVPTSATYMIGYDALRSHLLASADPSNHLYTAAATLFAGGLARALVVSVVSPLELLRTRLQSARGSFQDVTRAYRLLVREQGPTALWRGLPPTLWRDVPFSAIYWASYEFVRRGLTGGRGMGEMAAGESRGSAFAVAFVSGAVSGSVRGLDPAFDLAVWSDARRTDRRDLHEPVRRHKDEAAGVEQRRACTDDGPLANAREDRGLPRDVERSDAEDCQSGARLWDHDQWCVVSPALFPGGPDFRRAVYEAAAHYGKTH